MLKKQNTLSLLKHAFASQKMQLLISTKDGGYVKKQLTFHSFELQIELLFSETSLRRLAVVLVRISVIVSFLLMILKRTFCLLRIY